MPAQFAGQIVLVVNGLPIIHLKSLDHECITNRELVVGMNPAGVASGFVAGTKEYSVSIEVYIPKTGDLPWEDITDAVIASVPRDGGLPAHLFTGFFTEKVGETYQEKGAAIRKIEGKAIMKVSL